MEVKGLNNNAQVNNNSVLIACYYFDSVFIIHEYTEKDHNQTNLLQVRQLLNTSF